MRTLKPEGVSDLPSTLALRPPDSTSRPLRSTSNGEKGEGEESRRGGLEG